MSKLDLSPVTGPIGSLWRYITLCLISVVGPQIASAQETQIARSQAQSAVVISKVGGETVRFASESDFRALAIGQVLVDGDVVRTGPTGALGLLFVDRTAMRLHPNTELTITQVSDTRASLELTSGKVWARTPRETNAPVTVRTPSAAAAIRGTDWTLSVDAAEVTSVFVYDGQVDLTNAQGSVSAEAGSGVSAARGAVPRTVQVVNLAERQQMLFSVTPGAAANAIVQFQRTVGDQSPGPAGWREGIALLRKARFDEAAALLERSSPGFDASRAAAARWIAAFARAEAGASIRSPATGGTAVDAFGRAYLSAYRGDISAAAAALGPLHTAPVALADAVRFAVYLDRFDEARQLLGQLQAVAAGSVQALAAEAFVKMIVDGNPSQAVQLYRRAVALDDQNPTLLSRLGMAEHTVGHPIEAEAALRKALALAPGDADILANLVVVLLGQYRVAEAELIVDQLSASSPGAFTTLMARARVDTSKTDVSRAEDSALQALAAQPGSAENSILLAIAAHRAGDDTRAQQELDAARRLDPNNPNIPTIRGAIALDYYRADEAIIAALEAERLFRQSLAAERLSANRKSGSILSAAFYNIGLDDWARDISDRSYDALAASSLFNEALTPRGNIRIDTTLSDRRSSYVFASETQGLLLEPLATATPLRFNSLVTTPFFNAEVTASLSFGGIKGSEKNLLLSGFTDAPIPLAMYLDIFNHELDPERLNDEENYDIATGLLGTQLTNRLSAIVAFQSFGGKNSIPGTVSDPTPKVKETADFQMNLIGVSYRLAERSVLSFASLSLKDRFEETTTSDRFIDLDFGEGFYNDQANGEFSEDFLGVGYRSDSVGGTWFAGYETVKTKFKYDEFESEILLDFPELSSEPDLVYSDSQETSGSRLFVQRRQSFSGAFEIEAELGLYLINIDDRDIDPFAPRLAFGAMLAPGHRIRAGYVRDIQLSEMTLGPSTVLGLFPIAAAFDTGSTTRATIFRYDGTFADRVHLSFEHQSLRYTDIAFGVGSFGDSVAHAKLERSELRAEAWLGNGVGAFLSFVSSDSETTTNGVRETLPGVPDTEASMGVTWVHPSRFKASARARYSGKRLGWLGGDMLDPVVTVDASLSWERPDKRMLLSAEVSNIFDADVQRAYDQGREGRQITFNTSIRF